MDTDKNSIKKDEFVTAISELLTETFAGSPETGSIYLDRGVGVFNSLEKINAEMASRSIAWEAATVAGHAEHARFYLQMLGEFMTGRTERADWNESWRVKTVDENEWAALQKSVRREYLRTLEIFGRIDLWDADKLGEAMAILAHTAYHLGAIRQIIKTF